MKLPRTMAFMSLLPSFVSQYSEDIGNLSIQKKILISAVAERLQKIGQTQRISYNLNICVQAIHLLDNFPEEFIPIVEALSGNPDLFPFFSFIESYLNHDELLNIIFTPQEKEWFNAFTKGLRKLQNIKLRRNSLLVSSDPM